MQLTHEQRRRISEDGFVVVEGVVPKVMVDAALRAINHSLGEGIDPSQITRYRAQSYCPELQHSPEIAGLFNETPARGLAESAIGEGYLNPVSGAQIALRFPTILDPPRRPGPHLDGMYSPTNGVPEGTIMNFTALMAVFLSDVSSPNAGNFTVWPGSHRIYEAYFREHRPQSLLEGMPKVDLPQPHPVTGRPGDVVLAHYMLGHSVGPNTSPHPRYACFFRLKHVEHDQMQFETMTDIWRHWPGIREVADLVE